MANIYQRILQRFGSGTPEHSVTASVTGNVARVNLTIEQPQNPMTVVFPPETEIALDGKLRTLEPDEVIFAKDIHYFGDGMTTETTIDGIHFKALNDPQEIRPLIMGDAQ